MVAPDARDIPDQHLIIISLSFTFINFIFALVTRITNKILRPKEQLNDQPTNSVGPTVWMRSPKRVFHNRSQVILIHFKTLSTQTKFHFEDLFQDLIQLWVLVTQSLHKYVQANRQILLSIIIKKFRQVNQLYEKVWKWSSQWKIQGFNGIRTRDLRDTGAML